MNKRTFFLMLNKNFSTEKTFIRNKALPACFDCLHFIEYCPYDSIPSDKQYSKCKKFGEMDLITGVIEYDFVKYCRDDINKCGKLGSEYIDRKDKDK